LAERVSAVFFTFMGMIQGTPYTAEQESKGVTREVMTPERLSMILGIPPGTLYKAWKKNGLNGWGLGQVLDEDDVSTIILYYANLRNETAIRLAESRRKEKETPGSESRMQDNGSEAAKESRKEKGERKASRWYYIADLIFYGVLAVSGYEMWFFMGHWGLLFWAIYAAAVSLSLFMAKDPDIPRTAQTGFTAVCILESLAFFGHFAMANLLIVRAAKAELLPFRYDAWGTLSAPFYIAGVLACVLSGIVIYAVWIRLNITKELNKKQPGNNVFSQHIR